MAKPQVRAVYSTDFTPQSNAVVTQALNEKAVAKRYLKRVAVTLLKNTLIACIACLFVGAGAWLESKYHIVGSAQASVQSIAKKGGK